MKHLSEVGSILYGVLVYVLAVGVFDVPRVYGFLLAVVTTLLCLEAIHRRDD
jgi:hypothetical protein